MPLQPRLDADSVLVAPQAMTNSATVTANLDTLGASYATIRIALASEINTNAIGPTLSLLSSDDTVVTNFATVVADNHRLSLLHISDKTVRGTEVYAYDDVFCRKFSFFEFSLR